MSFAGLSGKAALVTGAASGIGAATAQRLAAEGARVAVVDRDLAGAQSVADALPGAIALHGDVGAADDMARIFDQAVATLGRIDLFHLNAGISGPLGCIDVLELDAFDEVMRVNVRGTFLGLKRAVTLLTAQRSGGSIVLTSSIAGMTGSPYLPAYAASKHAIAGLAKSAAAQGARLGIRVNAVAPGIIATAMQSGAPQAHAGPAPTNPMGRMGTPEEVAALVVFLLSAEAPFITGALVAIDGGATADSPHKLPPPAG